MKALILIFAFIWAATAPMPRRAKFYFWVQVVGAVVMEGTLLAGSYTGADFYQQVYIVCTLAILASSFYLAWEAMRVWGVPMRVLLWSEGIGSAAFLTYLARLAILHDYHQFPAFLTITLGEATLLVIAGSTMGFTVPLLTGPDKLITGVLAGVWIVKAGILYLYSINILGTNQDVWLQVGALLPALLFLIVCGYLGRKLRVMTPA